MIKFIYNYPKLFIFLAGVITLVFYAHLLPVGIMEARNFISAREMLTEGNWLLTTLNGEPRYEKPPLPTWITAGFGYVLGITNVWALRLPAIIMFGLTGVGVFLVSMHLNVQKWHAMLNAFICITSFYVIAIVFEAPLDIYTHGFMLFGIYYLWLSFNGRSHYKNLLLASFFFGFSILSKGPVSVYAILLPFLVAYGIVFKFKIRRHNILKILLALVISLIVGGWWFLYVQLYDPIHFEEITSNEAEHWSDYHIRPFYYYWNFFIQSGIWAILGLVSLIYPYLKTRVSNLKAYQFSLLWVLIAVVLLSLIPEKKSRYLMPVLIPFAINCGFYMEYLIKNFKILDLKERIVPYLHFGVLIVVALMLPVVLFYEFFSLISNHWPNAIVLCLISLTSGIGMLYYLKLKNLRNVVVISISFLIGVVVFGMSFLKYLPQDNYKSLSHIQVSNKTKDLKIYGANYIPPELLWQYGSILPCINKNDRFQFPSENTFGLLATNLSDEQLKLINQNYTIKKIDYFDINWVNTDHRKHRERYTITYYEVTKR